MKSNYRPIGDFIRLVKVKNTDLAAEELLGINIDKYFMPSVANVVGTDLSNYKIVQPGQFACNRMHVGRDYRIPMALSKKNEPFMVSPAYDVFEITKPDQLLDEYLMMWFSRPEFDRNAWFHTDADVRGGLPWEMFCNLELPIPSIEKQREIVKEYNTVVNRIQLNEQLNQKLEETAQALYKHWFVDFDFPSEALAKDGVPQPYKSSGGKMIWNEELEKEIPEGWQYRFLSDFIFYQEGPGIRNWQFVNKGTNFLNIRCIKGFDINLEICNKISNEEAHGKYSHFLLKEKDIVIATSGDHGKLGKSLIIRKDHLPLCLNTSIIRFNTLNEKAKYGYLYSLLISPGFIKRLNGNATGTKQGNFGPTHLNKMKELVPSLEIQSKFDGFVSKIIDYGLILAVENKKLRRLESVLLSKITQVEVEEKEVV